MISDFFTKLLQRSLFKKFREIVLGYKHISTLHENDEDSSYQERVGKDVSEGDIKMADDGMSVVEDTQIGNIKRYDNNMSVVGSTQRDMSHA